MAEIQTSTWSETANSNNAAPPDGMPENQAASTVNDAARERMAAHKREWNRSHPTVTSAGTQPAYTLTYTTAPTAYAQGLTFAFLAHAAPTGSVTLNVNALGAKKVYDRTGTTQLASGAFAINTRMIVSYDIALDGAAGGFVWLNDSRPSTTDIAAAFATETTLASDDLVLFTDTSETNAPNKMTVANFSGQANRLSGAPVLLQTLTASTSAALAFTAADNTKYCRYVFEIVGLQPATDGVSLYARMDANAGASFDSGASDYAWSRTLGQFTAGGTRANAGDDADAQIIMATLLESDGRKFDGTATMRPGSANSSLTWEAVYQLNDATRFHLIGGGVFIAGGANAVQFLMSSGNITAGVIYCYGIPIGVA